MNHRQAMFDNLEATWDAMLDVRVARDRLVQLDSQREEIADEFKKADVAGWVDFYCDSGKPGERWKDLIAIWEQRNPGWKICGNGLRKTNNRPNNRQ